MTAQGPDGELIYANDAAARVCGVESSDELLALSVAEVLDRFEIVGEDGAPLPAERLPNRLAFVTGEAHEGVVGYRLKPGGEERWSVLRSTPQLSETGEVELVVNVFQDVTAERSAEARIRFLAEASSILSAPLGVEETLAELAALLVPRLADYCIVDLLVEDESLRQIVISHRDPEREALLRELRRRYHPEANPGHPVSRVIESGAPLLIPDARVGALAEAAVDEEHMRMYEALQALSYIVVPLATRGRLLGTISLGTGESRRRFGPPISSSPPPSRRGPRLRSTTRCCSTRRSGPSRSSTRCSSRPPSGSASGIGNCASSASTTRWRRSTGSLPRSTSDAPSRR